MEERNEKGERRTSEKGEEIYGKEDRRRKEKYKMLRRKWNLFILLGM